MKQSWVLVADHTRARIFAMENPSKPLQEVADLVHAAGGLLDQEQHSDRPGTTFDKQGKGRHGMTPGEETHHAEVDKFARELSARLQTDYQAGSFQALIIVAGPALLGAIRQHLSPALQKILKETVNKSVVELDEATIRARYLVI